MSGYVSEQTRRFVMARANSRCEYCLLHADDSFLTFQIDHIISLKHGGSSDSDNLACSCFTCNNNKGSDIGTMLLPDKVFIRFFNPREDRWEEHFEFQNFIIYSSTLIGTATIKMLKLNDIERIMERQVIASLS